MPSEAEFQAALNETANLVSDTGGAVNSKSESEIATFEDESGEMYSFTGHRCEEDDFVYIIVGSPEFRFMGILSFVDIGRYIAQGLDDGIVEDILENKPERRRPEIAAAEELLNRVNQEKKEALEAYFHMMISGSGHTTSVERIDDDDQGSGIQIILAEEKIFPYESDFGIREFHQAKRSVIEAGERASKLITRTIFVDDDPDSDEDVELALNFGW